MPIRIIYALQNKLIPPNYLIMINLCKTKDKVTLTKLYLLFIYKPINNFIP